MKIKIGDIIAVLYFIAYTCLVVFFPWKYFDALNLSFLMQNEDHNHLSPRDTRVIK